MHQLDSSYHRFRYAGPCRLPRSNCCPLRAASCVEHSCQYVASGLIWLGSRLAALQVLPAGFSQFRRHSSKPAKRWAPSSPCSFRSYVHRGPQDRPRGGPHPWRARGTHRYVVQLTEPAHWRGLAISPGSRQCCLMLILVEAKLRNMLKFCSSVAVGFIGGNGV